MIKTYTYPLIDYLNYSEAGFFHVVTNPNATINIGIQCTKSNSASTNYLYLYINGILGVSNPQDANWYLLFPPITFNDSSLPPVGYSLGLAGGISAIQLMPQWNVSGENNGVYTMTVCEYYNPG